MKPILFVACEKVIIAEQTHALSLITVMTGADVHSVNPRETTEMPANAIIPMSWAVLAMWKPSQQDVGESFVQRLEVRWPNGDQFVVAAQPFSQADDKPHPVYANVIGFPSGQAGDVTIRLWLE